MRIISLSLLGIVFLLQISTIHSAQADQAKMVRCDYVFYGTPFASVQLELFPNGQTSDMATITQQGRSHTESITAEALAAGEMIHATLSKEDPAKSIEMVVYQQPTAKGQSKIINDHVPMAKEIWGNCAY